MMIVRSILALLFLSLVSACTHTAKISVLSASGIYDAEATSGSVRLRSNRSLSAFEDDTRPVEAVLSICGHRDRYWSLGAVTPTDDPHIYSAAFKAMADRADFEPDGRVSSGWPEDLARSAGVCVHLEAGEMLWLTLTSNVVVLPR